MFFNYSTLLETYRKATLNGFAELSICSILIIK